MSGGGTAGHISPVLAVLEELKKLDRELEVLYIGSDGPLEEKVLKAAGVEYLAISAGKFRRYNRRWFEAAFDVKTNWQNTQDFMRFNRGILQARKAIKSFKPEVVFVKGGYVGLPVGLVASNQKLPLIIHESDIVFGLTNRYLSKRAQKVAVGWPVELYKDMDRSNMVFTGSPLRRNAIVGNKKAALSQFRISEEKPIIFIIGGSRGAQSINYLVFENLAQLLSKYTIIHVTGENDIERARFVLSRQEKKLHKYYRPYSFLHNEMGLGYAAADVVVSRAGANSLSEIAAWSKPAVVIPLGSSANNHQAQNAQALSRMGAIRILHQHEMTGFKLMSEIDRLMMDTSAREYIGKTIHKFYEPDAAKKLASIIYNAGRS